MISRRSLVAAPLLLLHPLDACASDRNPDADVPTTHWMYDALQSFTQRGWAAGTPSNISRPLYTRRQLAEFYLNLLAAGSLYAGVGSAVHSDGWGIGRTLQKMEAELRPELTLLGRSQEELASVIERLSAFASDGRPQGVDVPLVRRLRRADRQAQREGYQAARSELENGETVLYVPAKPPRVRDVNLDTALNLRFFPEAEEDERRCQWIAGHNTEVWRRLREGRAPKAAPAWTPDLFDLAATWRRQADQALRLTREHPGAVMRGEKSKDPQVFWELVPHGRLDPELYREPDGRLRIEKVADRGEARLLFRCFPWFSTPLEIPALPPRNRTLEVLWGPAGSGVLYVRFRVPEDDAMPVRLYAVELRTGGILNAAATSA